LNRYCAKLDSGFKAPRELAGVTFPGIYAEDHEIEKGTARHSGPGLFGLGEEREPTLVVGMSVNCRIVDSQKERGVSLIVRFHTPCVTMLKIASLVVNA